MTLMPVWVWPGRIPSASAVSGLVMPKVFGMEGPVMSASRMPTLLPRLFISLASRLVTRDLPTPPLPETTPMTCLTLLRLFVSSLVGPAAVRSPHPETPQLPHSCEHSSAMIPSFLLCSQMPGSVTRPEGMIAQRVHTAAN